MRHPMYLRLVPTTGVLVLPLAEEGRNAYTPMRVSARCLLGGAEG